MILNDRVILITGCTQGISKNFANVLAKHNQLILLGRNEYKLKKLIKELGGRHKDYAADLSDQKQLKTTIENIKHDNDKIDCIFNIAGVGIYKNIEELDDAEWQYSLNLNVTAPYLLIKHLLPNLKKSNTPLIVNIGSGAGTVGMKGRCAYVASKFALRGLSLSLSEELSNQNIKVTLITLGSTLTNFGGTPVREKEKQYRQGKAYFTTKWVVDKVMEILSEDIIKDEYVLYPGDFGFGEWKKP